MSEEVDMGDDFVYDLVELLDLSFGDGDIKLGRRGNLGGALCPGRLLKLAFIFIWKHDT